MSNQIVARFLDGRVLKGTSLDVNPKKPSCHIRADDGKSEHVQLKDLKALFFVRSPQGDPKRDDRRTPVDNDMRLKGSTLISVRFADNESIVGLANEYPPTKPFFFMMPVDPDSNNIRILVNRAAIVDMNTVAE